MFLKYYFKKAFTLAEVLIALGIIGVVAAMTLPNVIKHYQQQVVVSKVKKFYTNMNQVLQMARAENGDFSTWDKSNTENFYKIYIKPYIKHVNDDYEYPVHLQAIFESGLRFTFTDGTQAIIKSTGCEMNSYKSPIIIFYTQGYSESNKTNKFNSFLKHPSREYFYFEINSNGNLVPPEMTSSRQTLINKCSKLKHNNGIDYGNNGYYTCSTLIYLDGWKIGKDYPW